MAISLDSKSLKSRVRSVLREVDPNESIRRKLRIARNFFKEPPPRSKELILDSYSYEHPEVRFEFRAPSRSFSSTVRFECIEELELRAIGPERLHRLMTLIGMSLVPYHFLVADFRSVRVKCGRLTPDAINFYQEYFQGGLAEFRYRQGLDPTRPIEVIADHCDPLPTDGDNTDEKILMLNGGGKDTAVMCELLKLSALPLSWLSINPRQPQREIESISGVKTSLSIDVNIDASIFRRPTYAWGHMPTSGMLLSMSMIPAMALRYRYITTGNECSANEGNVRFRDMDINHQYTKSHHFESRFNDVMRPWLGIDTWCFSALRMFHDLQIAAMLAEKYDQYLGHFVSCNKGTGWCNDCEKCAFVFLSLSAFVEPTRLAKLFGADLWQHQRTRALMFHLMTGKVKRWECVGTREECRAAARLHFSRFGSRTFSEWPSLRDMQIACKYIDDKIFDDDLLSEINEPHNIPMKIERCIKEELSR